MTDDVKTKIAEKGTNPALIDRTIEYAGSLTNANVTQESLMVTTKEVSEEAIKVFNDLYAEIVGICKIAASYYKYEPLKKEQFTFNKVVAKMNGVRKDPEDPIA